VGREQAPFLLRLGDGSDVIARAVIDASGTWRTPNVLGAGGLPAVGEPAGATRGGAGGAAAHLEPALPDVLGADRERFAGRHTLVVGSGHSAANTLLALAALRADAPGTRVTWAVRGPAPTRAYGGGDADQLPARGALGSTLRELVASGDVELLAGFRTRALIPAGGRVEVVGEDGESAPGRGGRGADRGAGDGPRVVVDRVVVATGYRPDHALAAELRLDVDPVLGATRALAPLIDPNEHSCGTVPPHGVDELAHPEQDYWVVGAKAYGRAPTFLLATGYEQVRSVTAELAGDRAAAREVRLILPQTGVCSSDRPTEAAGDCCSAPAPTFATVVAAAPGGGCCT